MRKMFMKLTPRANVMKLFDVFSCLARVFVRLGWKSLPETNTLAYYESSQNTEKSLDNIEPKCQGHNIFCLSVTPLAK